MFTYQQICSVPPTCEQFHNKCSWTKSVTCDYPHCVFFNQQTFWYDMYKHDTQLLLCFYTPNIFHTKWYAWIKPNLLIRVIIIRNTYELTTGMLQFVRESDILGVSREFVVSWWGQSSSFLSLWGLILHRVWSKDACEEYFFLLLRCYHERVLDEINASCNGKDIH